MAPRNLGNGQAPSHVGCGRCGWDACGCCVRVRFGAQAIAQQTDVGIVFAIGLIPWAMRFSLASIPASWLGRAARVAAVAAISGVVAVFAPLALLIPPAVLLVWALVNVTDRAAWRAVAVSGAAALLAVPLLFPWLGAADLSRFVSDGTAYWVIPTFTAIVAGVAALATLLAAPQRLALVAGWGAITAVGGAFVARSVGFDLGREVEGVGLALVTLGLALIVGPSFEAITRAREVGGWRRLVAGVAVAGSVFLVAASTVTVVGGRAGLPGRRIPRCFHVHGGTTGRSDSIRILVVGAPGDLPGEDRTVDGAAYRLVSAPMPESWETYLHEPRIGDEALADTLRLIIGGETKRAGELLASYRRPLDRRPR